MLPMAFLPYLAKSIKINLDNWTTKFIQPITQNDKEKRKKEESCPTNHLTLGIPIYCKYEC